MWRACITVFCFAHALYGLEGVLPPRNAIHRGELVLLCNEMGLTGMAAEIGVNKGEFAQHNLRHWLGTKYYMIDAWSFRKLPELLTVLFTRSSRTS